MTHVVGLLGARDVREIAGRLGIRPTKKLGQNFVVEPGTVRQIAALAGPFTTDDVILEVGPGLGSLTLALLEAADQAGARLIAVEIDPILAAELPKTIADRAPSLADRLTVIQADAMEYGGTYGGERALRRVAPRGAASGSERAPGADPASRGGSPWSRGTLPAQPDGTAGTGAGFGGSKGGGAPLGNTAPLGSTAPTILAANLPYNVAVPVVLHLLAAFPSIERGVVMVQAEVADRMCAGPGSRVYGVPSAKLAWFASARPAGTVPRGVFWPVPNVDSKLVVFTRRDPPAADVERADVFAVIEAAFGQRRKTLRAALATWAGSPAEAERLLRAAGVDPGARGESLGIAEFAQIASAHTIRKS